MRRSGVLLPLSAQMGEFGIGDMGQNSRFFLDFIKQMGFSIWQVLPVTAIGNGNSPYSGFSAFAGNPLLIDLYSLEGLLSFEEIASAKIDSPYKVDYIKSKENKTRLLKLAFSRCNEEYKERINAFVLENSIWVRDYALYSAIKEDIGNEWYEWDNPIKLRDFKTIEHLKILLNEAIQYFYFEQYVFFSQWLNLKKYANSIGIKILGDMPIYISYDSVDLWVNNKDFLLDENLKPKFKSGVPPDYFSTEGQFWGNPLYDYKKMESNAFKWLVSRIQHNLSLYDILRIDHFRGLYEYWSVPSNATSAKEGKWEKGPGHALWDNFNTDSLKDRIVAEDLGIIDEKVSQFRKELGFPGMRVVQFGFDGDKNNLHLPHNYESDTYAYTSTHDNPPTLAWLYSLSAEERSRVLDYFGFFETDWGSGGRQARSTKQIARVLLSSTAENVIIPLQDLCSYGADTRINIPGEPLGNWEYRCTLSSYEDIDVGFFAHLNNIYGRV
ncbi:MAG: 4-alpha-glucanotransferase [Firmicutes bacterium ADurb.Bin080]|jgi:4-alpha-glucanotransferase|nr:4-alpha-glucanotransferase [Clostridiales bacterium]OQC14991.1 MAG: 4-alpha-glucanotransferase [Firmicutes bacterium ADurb.Bin080]